MIDLIAKFSGFNVVWGVLDGYKTRIAAIAGILSGLAGLINEFLPIEQKHSFSALLAFAKALPTDRSWLTLLGGLGVLGIGHKLEKANKALLTPPQPPAP